MPTTNPRVNVTLSPSLDHLVGRMAALQRVSKSQVLRELLEAAEPALQRAVTLMAAAAEASSSVRQGLSDALEAGMSRIEAALEDELDRTDRTPDLVVEAQAVRGRRPRSTGTGGPAGAPGRLETPVPLTGGLGLKTRGPGKPGKPASAVLASTRKGASRGRV